VLILNIRTYESVAWISNFGYMHDGQVVRAKHIYHDQLVWDYHFFHDRKAGV
jgi:hypothetical protein